MKTLSTVILFAVIALLISCDNGIVTIENSIVKYSSYVFVDEDAFYLGKFPSKEAYSEPVLNWEQTMGEPFKDVNGNGRFDNGIDIFVISDDSTNQDLDHNGRYTAPGEPWSPGLLFDDLNGNGIYDTFPGHYNYEPGMYYCDFNNNGVHDNSVYYRYALMHSNWDGYSDRNGISYITEYAIYNFISDSGMSYQYPVIGQYDFMGMANIRFNSNSSVFSDTITTYLDKFWFFPWGLSWQIGSVPVKVIDIYYNLANDGLIYNDRLHDKKYYAEIMFYNNLMIEDELYDSILTINLKCESGNHLLSEEYNFYYQKDFGLLGFENLQNSETSFVLKKLDSHPLQMIQ